MAGAAGRAGSRLIDIVARARLSGLRSARSGSTRSGHARALRRAVPAADRADPQDWRARLALGRHLAARGQPAEALDRSSRRSCSNPHGLIVHQAIWVVLLQLELDRGPSSATSSRPRMRCSTSIRTSA